MTNKKATAHSASAEVENTNLTSKSIKEDINISNGVKGLATTPSPRS